MKIQLAVASCLAALGSSAASAAPTYNFVVAPLLGLNGRPIADDAGRVDGRTFRFTIGANETPTPDISKLFGDPNYRIHSYTYTEFGSTVAVVVPATLGKNIVFGDYLNQGGVSLTNSGNRNFALYSDTPNGDMSEILYNDLAYKAALALDPAAQPIFKTGTFVLSTYPRNNSPIQPIQNYTVTISLADAMSAVPEPTTWGMMMLGIGAVGYAMRRRDRIATRFSSAA